MNTISDVPQRVEEWYSTTTKTVSKVAFDVANYNYIVVHYLVYYCGKRASMFWYETSPHDNYNQIKG